MRQAVAVRRGPAGIVTGPYESTVEPLYSLIPRGFLGHGTPFFDRYPDDAGRVERARKLLEEADVETPVAFTLGHREGAVWAAEAAELRRQLEESGLFRVTVKSAEWTRFQEGYGNGEYDAYGLGWVPDFPDPDNFTQPLVGRDNALQNAYESPGVDKLVAATQGRADRSRAVRDFRQIQEAVAQDVPVLPLWQKKDYVLSTGDVAGSQYLSDGTGIWRLWHLSWL